MEEVYLAAGPQREGSCFACDGREKLRADWRHLPMTEADVMGLVRGPREIPPTEGFFGDQRYTQHRLWSV